MPYLLIMSVTALPLFLFLRKKGNRLFTFYKRLIEKSPHFLYLFVIPLIIIEMSLESRYPLTMALYNDWYAFSYYFVCLIAGYSMASMGSSLWEAFIKIRYKSLIVGILASTVVFWMLSKGESPVWVQIIKPVNVWSWIITIFGFGSKYLNRRSNILAYRNKAVYPFYIVHFTITIFLGYLLMNHPMHYIWKMIIMVSGTYALSWLLYEYIISRLVILRPLFGIRSKK